MKFRYIGEEVHEFEMFGAMWSPGAVNEITNEAHAAKLANNQYFEPVSDSEPSPPDIVAEGAAAAPERRKPGRPKRVLVVEEADDQNGE